MSPELVLAVEAARDAGKIIRRAFGTALRVDYKGPDQPVTAADADADALLKRALLGSTDGYGWISEESSTVVGSTDRIWVVDPLDGTINFVEGRPEFAVCVGLVCGGMPVLGVVYNPMTDDLYTAEGGSALLNGRPMNAAWETPPRLVVSWGDAERYAAGDSPREWRISTVGSTALKLMAVASGAAEAYVSGSSKKIWDVLAPGFIAECAGCTVFDIEGRPISYSTRQLDVVGTLAVARGGEQLIEQLIALGQNRMHPGSEVRK